ncbi:MAG TPA: class I SAM-dependent methyltransferase [Phnomibacter sp.]|nr:class I SAM-dependent methyltransferase [Phnomibacter sp.]
MNHTDNVADRSHLDYEEWYHKERHNTHFNEKYYNARAKIAVKKFFEEVGQNDSILDFGCGLGQNILYIPNAVGYDISKFGVEFARKKGINATNNLEDLPDNSFDIVFSSHVLEHHPHPKTMLEDIYRKLKPGGKLILVIPHERHGMSDGKLDLNQHLYAWNFQSINNLLLTTGFQVKGNKYIRGAGYNKLLPLAEINFGLYRTATNVLSTLAGIKEMMTVALKK